MQAGGLHTWRTVRSAAMHDVDRPKFVRRLASHLRDDRSALELPGGARVGDLRDALDGLRPVPTHRTSVDGARALLDAPQWHGAEGEHFDDLRDARVIGAHEDASGIGYVAIHLEDGLDSTPLPAPAAAQWYGNVRLSYAQDALHDMTFTARQHHEMRPQDLVPRGTIETLHRVYAQRLVDWTQLGLPVPAPTRDALRGWMLDQDQRARFLLEGQARGLAGDRIRSVELFPSSIDAMVGMDELAEAARARGISVRDYRSSQPS